MNTKLFARFVLLALVAVTSVAVESPARADDGDVETQLSANASLVGGSAGFGAVTGIERRGDERGAAPYYLKLEAGGMYGMDGSGAIVGRAGAAFFGRATASDYNDDGTEKTDHGSGFLVGEPNIVHSDGRYLQLGVSPTCLMMGACGYGHATRSPNGVQLIMVTPRIMYLHDMKRNLDSVGFGLQLAAGLPLSEKHDLDLLAQVGGVSTETKVMNTKEQAAGAFYLLEASLKYKLQPHLALTAGASVSDAMYAKALSDGASAVAPAITVKLGAAAAY